MRTNTMKAWFLGGLVCLSGCSGLRNTVAHKDAHRPARPINALDLPDAHRHLDGEFAFASQPATVASRLTSDATSADDHEVDSFPLPGDQTRDSAVALVQKQPETSQHAPNAETFRPQKLTILPVALKVADEGNQHKGAPNGGRITIDGRNYEIRLIDQSADGTSRSSLQKVNLASQHTTLPEHPFEQATHPDAVSSSEVAINELVPDAILLNLPSALSMVGRDHPLVGFAQWKVQEAYANLEQAEVLWLPNIQTGFSFHRHDGNYQASNGSIVDVNRSSFQYGLGAGATGAGTTPNPGIRAQFHLADAIFQPDIAQKTAWATCHAEKAVVNKQLRDVALAYMKLLDAHQQLRILEDVRSRTASLSQITDDFATAGQGLQADADRMRTELTLIDGRIAEAREVADVASARLAYAISAEPGRRILPLDPTVVPIELVASEMDQGSLISTGLSNRPELKELQALVSAACDQYERQKYAPFVPSVLLGLSAGGFGGDTGSSISNVNDRIDFDAMVTWEIRNFGFGERSARRRTEAQVQQAMYRKIGLIDDVAREVAEAHTQVIHRRERVAVTRLSIQSAQDSYERNLSRIREGQGLPIEVLQSVKALEAARRAYLEAVIAYNEAQFQLQWALGWQVTSPQ